MSDINLPFPTLHACHSGIWVCECDGSVSPVSKGEAIGRAADTPMIMMNAPLVAQRLGYAELSGLDLLELFAFIYPAQFMVPTPAGLAKTLGLSLPQEESDIAALYRAAAVKLLQDVKSPDWKYRTGSWDSAQSLYCMRWPWASTLNQYLRKPSEAEPWLFSRLKEWEESPPRGAPRNIAIEPETILGKLDKLTGDGAEKRQGQRDYAQAAGYIFAPRKAEHSPNMLLAEAGTGIGKTLGYLAPTALWSKAADGAVWISTYTKALQRQLTQETRRLYPNDNDFQTKVVVRKGRENYLCLLNLEDALQGGFAGRAAILAQLVARWAAYSKDGDMVGGDLPGWLTTLFRRNGSNALTDRRGECIYAGCPHYKKCFIERASRDSQNADIVIANHALVMVNAARGREHEHRPSRIIFDEGHHLFDAADSMFGAALTGQETIELRRWIIGPEGKARGRRRGLSARLADVASYDEAGAMAINAASNAAEAFPSEGWLGRIQEGTPFGPFETLFAAIRQMVYTRDESADSGYSMETELVQIDAHVIEASEEALSALDDMYKALNKLGLRLESMISEPPDWMDGQARARIDGAIQSLAWRVDTIAGWMALLSRLNGVLDPDFVDWIAVDRFEGREYDMGLHRHWLDPMIPVKKTVYEPTQGVMVTSATLKSGGDWNNAQQRTGAHHLDYPPIEFEAVSPFDYANQAQVLIVTDIKRGDNAALAGAYAQLISASGGGALGLFTAIKRLRSTYARIADKMARDGLPLYAQHVDPIDTGTLVDIFRDDPNASLLGTDALRDGVDVPGDSLRLVIMEQIPWPRPDILHKARRLANGGTDYDDRIIRARLAQAFGRLIRRADDVGHFILLSAATPSRLLNAFPEGTLIKRVTLEEAIETVKTKLSSQPKLMQKTQSFDIEDNIF